MGIFFHKVRGSALNATGIVRVNGSSPSIHSLYLYDKVRLKSPACLGLPFMVTTIFSSSCITSAVSPRSSVPSNLHSIASEVGSVICCLYSLLTVPLGSLIPSSFILFSIIILLFILLSQYFSHKSFTTHFSKSSACASEALMLLSSSILEIILIDINPSHVLHQFHHYLLCLVLLPYRTKDTCYAHLHRHRKRCHTHTPPCLVDFHNKGKLVVQ